MSLDVETQQEEMQIEAAEVTEVTHSREAESDRLAVAEAHEEIEMLPAAYDVRAEMDINDRLRADFEKIPDTMAFKIGDAADLVGVKTYVLRFWESEFEALRPKKSRNGQRVYSRRDLETAMMIRKLLYDDKFSIEGARAVLKSLRHKLREEREKGPTVPLRELEGLEGARERAVSGLRQILEVVRGFRANVA
ncbi:MAG TPA: MerR family transcriptional regulator [Pseudobdellovibrionaceae bacterium]|nr:MerR family transcriptional regulator [Pseudobdellovibrionaceae bacterium]